MLDASFDTNRFDAFGRKKSSTAGVSKRMTENGFHRSGTNEPQFDVIPETVSQRRRKTNDRKHGKDDDPVYDDVIKCLSESRPLVHTSRTR